MTEIMTEELKIEVGKSYRTKSGYKVYIGCKVAGKHFKFIGYCVDIPTLTPVGWCEDGETYVAMDELSIIKEWIDEPKEPECIDVSEMWVIVNEDCDGKIGIDGTYYKNKEDCLTYKNTIAILTSYEWERRKSGAVPLVRGEGME